MARSLVLPAITYRDTSYSLGSRLSVPYPTNTPLTYTACTLSAPPTCSTICVPFHGRGTANVVRYSPVVTRSGNAGGGPANGICTLV